MPEMTKIRRLALQNIEPTDADAGERALAYFLLFVEAMEEADANEVFAPKPLVDVMIYAMKTRRSLNSYRRWLRLGKYIVKRMKLRMSLRD